MNTPVKKRDRLRGLRVFVRKPNGDGVTTISIPRHQVRALRRLALWDEQVLTQCARDVSRSADPVAGQTWSAVVVSGMFKYLYGLYEPEQCGAEGIGDAGEKLHDLPADGLVPSDDDK
jgi:hypothetical protein